MMRREGHRRPMSVTGIQHWIITAHLPQIGGRHGIPFAAISPRRRGYTPRTLRHDGAARLADAVRARPRPRRVKLARPFPVPRLRGGGGGGVIGWILRSRKIDPCRNGNTARSTSTMSLEGPMRLTS